jgi:hypothetical protein
MNGRRGDRLLSQVAGASGVVAASLAAFWTVQMVRQRITDDIFLLVNIFILAAMAYVFGRVAKNGGRIGVVPSILFLGSAVHFLGKDPWTKKGHGVSGIVTFVLSVCVRRAIVIT